MLSPPELAMIEMPEDILGISSKIFILIISVSL